MKVQFSQMILGGLVSRIGGLLVADHRLVHSSLLLEECSKGILGAGNPGFSRLPEPEFSFFVIWEDT